MDESLTANNDQNDTSLEQTTVHGFIRAGRSSSEEPLQQTSAVAGIQFASAAPSPRLDGQQLSDKRVVCDPSHAAFNWSSSSTSTAIDDVNVTLLDIQANNAALSEMPTPSSMEVLASDASCDTPDPEQMHVDDTVVSAAADLVKGQDSRVTSSRPTHLHGTNNLVIRTTLLPRDMALTTASNGHSSPRLISQPSQLGLYGTNRRRQRSVSLSPGPYPVRRLRLQSPTCSSNGDSPCALSNGMYRAHSANSALGHSETNQSATSGSSSSVVSSQSGYRLHSPTYWGLMGTEMLSGRPMVNGRELAVPRSRHRASSITLLHSAATAAAVVAQSARRICNSNTEEASSEEISASPVSMTTDVETERSDSTDARTSSTNSTASAHPTRHTPVINKMRSKLLGRVQMMLEDESSPLEKEVKMEREIQEQLREQDEANILAGGSTILHDIARPRLGTEEAANGTVYTRSRLNPDWDYFRGEPSPSPSSSCVSSPGLYPHPGTSPVIYRSGSPNHILSTVPWRGKRKASCDRIDPYASTSANMGNTFYKRRAASPSIHPGSPRPFVGGSPRVLPIAVPIAHSAYASRRNSLMNVHETDVSFSRLSLEDARMDDVESSVQSSPSSSTSTYSTRTPAMPSIWTPVSPTVSGRSRSSTDASKTGTN